MKEKILALDPLLDLIFEALSQEAVGRYGETPEWKEVLGNSERALETLRSVVPEESHDILREYRDMVGQEDSTRNNYVRELIFFYGVRLGIQIAGGI